MKQLIAQEQPSHNAFNWFLHNQTAGGIILLLVSLVAFVLANTGAHDWYEHLAHTHVGIAVGDWHLDFGIHHWVNDGLMAIFFFVVGLEIKREILVGELSTPKKAALSVFAALGGMIVPAALYAMVNINSPETQAGWGIPMATDIAFAIGVLSILGKRVPITLKVFLTALAIVDDLGAILVIAIFYSEKLQLTSLLMAFVFVALSVAYGRRGGTRGSVFTVLCIGCWYFTLMSGIHATIAGVLMALTIPIRQRYELGELNRRFYQGYTEENFEVKEDHLEALERVIRKAESPLHRFEHKLHPWVVFCIMPIFAFFNAGVVLPDGDTMAIMSQPHTLGIILGLVVGKPLGVVAASWLSVKMGIAALPERVTWGAMLGMGFLAGLGFTMSLFIAVLAFPEGAIREEAKLAILCASLLATFLGMFLTHRAFAKPAKEA